MSEIRDDIVRFKDPILPTVSAEEQKGKQRLTSVASEGDFAFDPHPWSHGMAKGSQVENVMLGIGDLGGEGGSPASGPELLGDILIRCFKQARLRTSHSASWGEVKWTMGTSPLACKLGLK